MTSTRRQLGGGVASEDGLASSQGYYRSPGRLLGGEEYRKPSAGLEPPLKSKQGKGQMEKQETLRRMRTVEGHVRGIERMLESDAYCIDVIRQIQAVQSALTKISVSVLDDHLQTCLVTAVKGDRRDQMLKEITEVYEMASKV